MKKASVGVKRLLMYALILLCVLFVGFLAYFFARNDEQITFSIDDGSVIYLNKGETFALPIVHEDADKDTKIMVEISDDNVLTYSEPTLTFSAVNGGMTSVIISTTNKHFGPYRFDMMVGDGSVANPWYVSSASQLTKIGTTEEWKVSESYELINDIDLANLTTENKLWTPIGTQSIPFSGRFNGNGYAIKNLKIDGSFAQTGFFGAVSGNVEGINFTGAEIISSQNDSYVGIVAGINYGTISRIIADGTITANAQATAGGIVGSNEYQIASANLSNVSATVNFTGTYTNLGGIAGTNTASIIYNAKTRLNLETTINGYFGGIVAQNNANAQGQYNYTRPIIKNCYTIIDSINDTTNCGLIVGNNVETTNSLTAKNLYVSNYGYNANINSLCVNGKNPVDTEMKKAQAPSELQETTTFAGWDFDQTWIFKDGFPEINIEASTTYHNEYIPGSDLTTETQVKQAVLNMIENPASEVTYTINTGTDIVIDCYELKNNTNWTPIGTIERPFKGNIVVSEGTTLTFTNIKIETNYTDSGFFGVFAGNIDKINFKDIQLEKVENNGSLSAGVVAALAYGGTIKNCTVDNAQITNFDYVGFIAGKSSILIENCNVTVTNTENTNTILNNVTTGSATYGGIVGYSSGSINNCSVDFAKVESKAKTNYIGGIAGVISNNTISKCANIGLSIVVSVESTGFSTGGGIAGQTTGASKIISSYNLGNIDITTNENSYAGGIVAWNSEESIVKTSFSDSPRIQATYVGGLASLNNGTVFECYSQGEYRGYNVGGLAYENKGNIYNCYTQASVVGTKADGKDSVVAGLVAFLPEEGSVSYCFGNATITGTDGTLLFAETSARIRYSDFENWFDNLLGSYKPGTLSNCVVINYGEAEVQNKLIFGSNDSWVECTDDDCRGLTGNNPFEKAGFTTNSIGVWTYTTGEYPTLTNCVVIPEA